MLLPSRGLRLRKRSCARFACPLWLSILQSVGQIASGAMELMLNTGCTWRVPLAFSSCGKLWPIFRTPVTHRESVVCLVPCAGSSGALMRGVSNEPRNCANRCAQRVPRCRIVDALAALAETWAWAQMKWTRTRTRWPPDLTDNPANQNPMPWSCATSILIARCIGLHLRSKEAFGEAPGNANIGNGLLKMGKCRGCLMEALSLTGAAWKFRQKKSHTLLQHLLDTAPVGHRVRRNGLQGPAGASAIH